MNLGDLVVRISHNKDIVFKIIRLEKEKAILEGVNFRLIADALLNDLELANKEITKENDYITNMRSKVKSNTIKKKGYLPGKILHLDGDEDYLRKCLTFYKECGLYAKGDFMDEADMAKNIIKLIEKYTPEVVVLTGHDSFNKRNPKDLNNYLNSQNFINAVLEIRKHYSKDSLVVIAGACASNFEALIASGANFATSPERVNVHALDPSIAAIKASFTPFNRLICLDDILKHTFVKRNGLGGVETYGKMRLIL